MNVPALTPEQRAYVERMQAEQDAERYGTSGTAGMVPGSSDYPQAPGPLPTRVSPAVTNPADRVGARPVAAAQRPGADENPFLSLLPKVDPPDAPPTAGMAPSGPPQGPAATTLPARPAEAPTGPQSGPMRIEVNGVGNPPGPSDDDRRREALRQGLQMGPVGNFMSAIPGRVSELVVGKLGGAAADAMNLPKLGDAARRFGAWRPTGFDPTSTSAKLGGFAADTLVGGKAAEGVGAGVQAAGMGIGATRVPAAAKLQQAMDAAGNAIKSFGGFSGLPRGGVDLATRMGGGAVAGAVSAAATDPQNVGLSAALGGATPLMGAAGGAIGGAIADVARPFRDTGRAQIAGQVFRDAAQDPNALRNLAPRQTLGGQNVAEATLDPGLSRLVQQMRADPRVGKEITAFEQLQNARRAGPLMDRFTGANAPEALAAARKQATAPLYNAIDPADLAAPANTMGVRRVVQNIAGTPRFQTDAVNKEVINAVTDKVGKNSTIPRIADPVAEVWRREVPSSRMWGMRQNIDQRLYGGQATKAAQTAQEASKELNAIRRSLSTQLAKVPGFSAAEQTYAKMSKPIEAAEVFRDIAKGGTTGTFDAYGNPTLAAAKFTTTLKNMDAKEWAKLDAGQRQFIRDLGRELSDSATALAMGIGKGSPTNQLGQGQKFLSNAITSGARNLPGGGFLANHFGTIMERNQNAIMDLVGQGVLDPATAARLAQQMPQQILTPSLFGALNRPVTSAPNLLPQ